MLIKLIFDIEGKLFWYRVRDYQIIDDFYIFTDLKDGKERKFHKTLLRGEEPL